MSTIADFTTYQPQRVKKETDDTFLFAVYNKATKLSASYILCLQNLTKEMKEMKKSFIGLLCLLSMLTACAPSKPDAPTPAPPASTPSGTISPESSETPEQIPEDPDAISFFDCGTLNLSNEHSITGRENFEEFLNVTGAGKSATIALTKKDTLLTLSFDGNTYTLKDAEMETTWKQIQIVESSQSGEIYQTFRLTNEENLAAETPDGERAVTLFQESIES